MFISLATVTLPSLSLHRYIISYRRKYLFSLSHIHLFLFFLRGKIREKGGEKQRFSFSSSALSLSPLLFLEVLRLSSIYSISGAVVIVESRILGTL
jgi:hypothetical protein